MSDPQISLPKSRYDSMIKVVEAARKCHELVGESRIGIDDWDFEKAEAMGRLRDALLELNGQGSLLNRPINPRSGGEGEK